MGTSDDDRSSEDLIRQAKESMASPEDEAAEIEPELPSAPKLEELQ